MKDFTTLIDRTVGPLHAGMRRKRAMQAELLAHLEAAYAEELRSQSDTLVAARRAEERLGDIDDLRMQLQASVPLVERLLCKMNRKEIPMSGWLWTIVWLVLMLGMITLAPADLRPPLLAVAAIGTVGIVRLTRDDQWARRWLGPRWAWRILAMLFGTSIILPALAKLKHGLQTGVLTDQIVMGLAVCLSIGALVIFIGIVSSIHAITSRRSSVA